MTPLQQLMKRTLSVAQTESPGSLTYGGAAHPVCVAFSTDDALAMAEAGYDPDTVGLVVTLAVSDMSGTDPVPGDAVTLDGVDYVVKSPITKNPVFWMIPLREVN